MALQILELNAPRLVPSDERALPRIYIVGPQHGGLSTALAEALAGNVRLTAWERPPLPSGVAVDDLVIVDLTVTHGPTQPRTVTALLDRVEVWLVVGTTPVDPGWVDYARHARVRVFGIASGRHGHLYDAVVTPLLERYGRPACRIDAQHLLLLEPSLQPVQRYIEILSGHPWLVRRPRDLADLAHTSLRALKLECQSLGFTRVEHFIIFVRAIAYEQLIARGLTARDARRLSGFSDPSNMRRHLRRALRRSPDALARRTPA